MVVDDSARRDYPLASKPTVCFACVQCWMLVLPNPTTVTIVWMPDMPHLEPLTDDQRRELQRAMSVIDAIDTEGKRDFEHVFPDVHAAGLPTEATPLRHIIQNKDVAPIVACCRQAKYGATKAQARQRVLFLLTLLPAGLALALALLVAIAYVGLDEQQELIISSVIWACFVVACLFTVYGIVKSVGTWRMASRESEETLRRKVFAAIVDANQQGATTTDIAPCLLQLEYFRRFQLGAQIDYYSTRIKEQGARHDSTNVWRGIGVVLFGLLCIVIALMAVGAAGEQGYFTSPLLAWFAALVHRLEAHSLDTWIITALLGCIAIYLFSLLSATQIGDHRSLYGDALSRLLAVQGAELEAARTAAAARNDPVPLREMAANVHKIMESEHNIWRGR